MCCDRGAAGALVYEVSDEQVGDVVDDDEAEAEAEAEEAAPESEGDRAGL